MDHTLYDFWMLLASGDGYGFGMGMGLILSSLATRMVFAPFIIYG